MGDPIRLFAPIGPRKDIEVIQPMSLALMLSSGEPVKCINFFFLTRRKKTNK